VRTTSGSSRRRRRQLQDALTQIAQNLLASKRQSQATQMQAEADAYLRALQRAEQQRYYASLSAPNFGGGAAGGGGGGSSSGGGNVSAYTSAYGRGGLGL
jgi:hypothetical protein